MGTDPAQATSQMYYNMTQLESVGITSVDQLPKTIDEFEALCDKLMETDYDVRNLCFPSSRMLHCFLLSPVNRF